MAIVVSPVHAALSDGICASKRSSTASRTSPFQLPSGEYLPGVSLPPIEAGDCRAIIAPGEDLQYLDDGWNLFELALVANHPAGPPHAPQPLPGNLSVGALPVVSSDRNGCVSTSDHVDSSGSVPLRPLRFEISSRETVVHFTHPPNPASSRSLSWTSGGVRKPGRSSRRQGGWQEKQWQFVAETAETICDQSGAPVPNPRGARSRTPSQRSHSEPHLPTGGQD